MKILPVLMAIAALMPQGQVRDPSAASSSRTAMIAGTITDDAGVPVARARVTQANAGGTVRLIGSTDDAGRFAFGGLPSGQFALQAVEAAECASAQRTQHVLRRESIQKLGPVVVHQSEPSRHFLRRSSPRRIHAFTLPSGACRCSATSACE